MSETRRWNWLPLVLGLWFVACLIVAVVAYLHPRVHTVFDIYAIASRAWCAGEDMFPRQVETKEIYRYSPLFAVATSPFAYLSPGLGNAAWKLVNAAAFAYALWAWCRRALSVVPTRNEIAAVFLFALVGGIGSLIIGQANLLMAAFVLLGLTAVAEDRWWWAAAHLAAATLVKAVPVALVMVLAVLFWRTFPWRFAVAFLVGLVLPFATQRPEFVLHQTRSWFHHLTESVELNRERLRSLDKLLEQAGYSVEPKVFMLFAAAAGAAVLAVALVSTWSGAPRRVVLLRLAGWFLTWVVLFSPATENVTYSILAPVVAWAIVDAFRRPGAWLRRLWLLETLYLIALSGGDLGWPLRVVFGDYAWQTIGGILFQLVLIRDLFDTPQPQSERAGIAPEPQGAKTLV